MRRIPLVLCILAGACTEVPLAPDEYTPAYARPAQASAYGLEGWEGLLWSEVAIAGDFTQDGRLWVDTDGSRKEAGRELCLDLSGVTEGEILDPEAWDLFRQEVEADPSSAGLGRACTTVTLHTRDHSNEENAGGQPVGTTHHAGGKIVLKDFAVGDDNWEWRLQFDVEGALSATDPERGRGVCIERVAAGLWHLYNDCIAQGETVDDDVRLTRFYTVSTGKGKATSTYAVVAEFSFPFRFSIVEQ